jgi:hypothetical protein
MTVQVTKTEQAAMDELKSGMDELNWVQNEMDELIKRIRNLEIQSREATSQLIGLRWRYQNVAQQLNLAHVKLIQGCATD